MTTMFQALLKTGELLKYSHRGIATGGTSTTLIDSGYTDEPDDFFNGGTLFILSGNYTGKTYKITDFNGSTGTFTISPASAITAGNEYAALRGVYARESLVMGINMALAELGPLPKFDIVTPSAVGEESYVLSGMDHILKVEYTLLSQSPYEWITHNHWRETDNRLVFDPGHVQDAVKYRIWYEADHAYVDEDDDTISDAVHPMLLAWSAAYYCALTRMQRVELDEPWTSEFVQLANGMKQLMASNHPIQRVPKTIHYARW